MNFYNKLFAIASLFVVIVHCSDNTDIKSARIESCPGCSLNRLPDVKKFIYEDVPKYKNVEFKKIHGAVPELILLGDKDNEIERLPLSKLSRQECNDLLVKKGFQLLENVESRTEF